MLSDKGMSFEIIYFSYVGQTFECNKGELATCYLVFCFPNSLSLVESLFTDKGFQVEHPDKMPLSSKRYNEAVALLHRMSDRQHMFHVCRGDGKNSNHCWCRINTATTQFPHSHIDTGHVCREPFCEIHTQFSRSQLDLGQCALFNRQQYVLTSLFADELR